MQIDFYPQANSQQSSSSSNREIKFDRTQYTDCQTHLNSPCFDVESEGQIRFSVAQNISQGNYAVAISLIDELIARYPDSAVDYNNRGLMYLRNNQLSEAIEDLTRALEINPQLDSAYNNRANCYVAQGNLAAAVADYDEALDLNPANLRARINQGITFREMGFDDLALENFDIVLIVGNQLQERAYAERGRTYHLRGDWNCAVADYQAALRLLSEQPDRTNYSSKIQNWLDDLLDPLLFS